MREDEENPAKKERRTPTESKYADDYDSRYTSQYHSESNSQLSCGELANCIENSSQEAN